MLSLFKRKKAANGQTATVESDALIDIRALEKAYQTEAGPFLALRGLNVLVQPGEFVSVVGKSGSGKSTLINMITGIDRPTAGEIIVRGTPIHLLSEGKMAEWRGRNMGIVFQFFQLLPTLTLLENVMLPMDFCQLYDPAERPERAMSLLAQVELESEAHKLPSAVSGGQQQRAAIARAIANDPPIIVADEPTGNLDSNTAESIFRLFQELVSQGKTILMVTHDGELAARAARTLTIADGELVGDKLNESASANSLIDK